MNKSIVLLATALMLNSAGILAANDGHMNMGENMHGKSDSMQMNGKRSGNSDDYMMRMQNRLNMMNKEVEQMHSTRDPKQRKKLYESHMHNMEENMMDMRNMGGGMMMNMMQGKNKGNMMGRDNMGKMDNKNTMMQMQQMEKRMDMMQMMMEHMMESRKAEQSMENNGHM